jgi:ubiquinone/menaquinone biosynthesis C-methylase UbiE
VTATYSERHLDPGQALAYRDKFRRSLTRRLSDRREHLIVGAAMRAALAELGRPSAESLLDLPCGAGRFAPLLHAACRSYTAADHSPHMLDLCRAALGGASARFERADARAMPFAGASFDLVCCLRLLHHFPDRKERLAILRELRRVCRGPLVLSWLDADAPKQWVHARRCELAQRHNRRAAQSRATLAAEAADAGLLLRRTWSLSGWFSGQSVALLVPADA